VIEVEFCTNGEETSVELLLPLGKTPQKMLLNGDEVPFSLRNIENSRYACIMVQGLGAHQITLKLV